MILFGGKSVEHDISIITALQVAKSLPEQYDYLPVYIDKNGTWWKADNLLDIKIYSNFEKLAKNKKQVTLILGDNILLEKRNFKFVKSEKIETVLNCCHGNIGEDGSVQGIFKVCGIAQTSSYLASSSLCMDKAFMKDVLKANNIKSPNYLYVKKCEYEQKSIQEQILAKIGLPIIVKPANLGSSIGISVCHNENEISDAMELAFEFDEKVLVEKLVENLSEFNCACFKYRGQYFSSQVNVVEDKSEIFSFEDKYLKVSAKNKEANKRLSEKIQKLTEQVFKLFDCRGVVRVDFLYDGKTLYVNEINSIPGSLGLYLFKNVPAKELLRCIIEESKNDFDNEVKLVKTFDSRALEIFNSVSSTGKK